MKTLLIAPPFITRIRQDIETYPPLGIMQISSFLKENGFKDVEMLDLSLAINIKSKIKKVIKEGKYQVVGISCIIASYGNSIKVAKLIKNINPKIKIVLGGIYPSFDDEKILKNVKSVDVIVRGEGELTFLELLNKWQSGNKIKNIAGISYKANNKIIRNPDRELMENLDQLPIPDYEGLKTIDYYVQKEKFLIITSRGCPYKCTFCSTSNYWKHKWRSKNSKQVLEEFKLLVKLGAKNILVGDDLFILDKKRVKEICKGIIANKMNIKWRCSCRVNLTDKESLKWLKKSGCDSVFIGGESGSQDTLNIIDKCQKVDEIIESRKWCKECGIKTIISFIIGFPWEKESDIRKTIDLAKKIKSDETIWFIFHTDIGSPIYISNKYNRNENYDPDKCIESVGVGVKTKYVSKNKLNELYLEAILETG